MSGIVLAIEISNPSSGAQGEVKLGGRAVIGGPGVALGREDGSLLAAEALGEGMRHDDDLMPAIDRMCRRTSVRPGDLSRVAVSIGPGGYTSLRIAIATAKMIAEATGASTVAVPSAWVAAWGVEDAATVAGPVVVCLASKGQTAWCELVLPQGRARAPWHGRVMEAIEGLVPVSVLEELRQDQGAGHSRIAAPLGVLDAGAIAALRPGVVVADRFLPPAMGEAAERVRAEVREPVFAAEFVLAIAARLTPVDPLMLIPKYPREPEAVTQWRRRQV